ncbi:putative holin protein [Brevundimonas phage vB_BpoS-Kabachok]|uniref:Holin protein n=2 Tax=Marchewkavirus TaxID=3425052 RepID=A0A9E7MPL2_9CAUD|nr:putative holin protein [Brevundimonas phage vB_BpoS-Kabachok]USN14915.1 putative holin protein [Brevundimonas phage vB_BpoS-Domovoi]
MPGWPTTPSPLRLRHNMSRFFRWMRDTMDVLCDRPDHLQRVSIILSGMSLFPLFVGMIIVLVWFAVTYTAEYNGLQTQIITGLINYGYIFLGLFALVIISMLGTIKGLSLKGPGGAGLTLVTTADDPDVDPSTSRNVDYGFGGGKKDDDYSGGGFGGGYGGFGGRNDFRGGRPMPSVDDDKASDTGVTD